MAMAEIEEGCDIGAGELAMLGNPVFDESKSNLYQHAKHELELAGLFDKDSDYNGELGNAVLELIKVFCLQGHSGYSATIVLELFITLAKFKILNPENFIPTVEESVDISEYSGKPAGTIFQSSKLSSVFSNDGGKNWYDTTNNDWTYRTPCRSNPHKK